MQVGQEGPTCASASDPQQTEAAGEAISPVRHVAPVRTRLGPSPPSAGATATSAEAADGWTAAGPFRGAPLLYMMHATPPGTPRTSPRGGPAGEGGDADLEAPLLPAQQPKSRSPFSGDDSGGVIRAVVFGLINAAAGIPALIAFCAVVFKDPLYHPYIDPLCKFFFLASALHQIVVSVRSDVPNAVGQVQDVGLIFLSAMASSIAALVAQDPEAALGTALITMAASTAVVGLGLIAVAKLQLAVVVQYLPLPAVGGYLSYVGYFCIASGLGLGCGIQLGPLSSWVQLLNKQAALRMLPTLGSTAAMMLTMSRTKHPLALPGVLLAIVAAFHAVLLAAGISLQEAQEAGWVLKPAVSLTGTGKFWDLWEMFDMPGLSLAHIHFSAALQQVGKVVGLFLLVCFGSCMDIAAIQQDTPFKMDFNKELTNIGVSNVVVGVMGCGFTGSFIFSQTIFTGRAGVRSRLNGAVIAAAELAMFAAPGSIVQYLPTFFFGSLLVWFGVEIVLDWMLRSAYKLTRTEYLLLWATFASIMQWGLEAGIAVGIVMATLYFAWGYAQSQLSAFALVPGRSGIVRSSEQEAALELLRPTHLVSAQLRGFLFFGVANGISTRLHAAAQCLDAAGLGGSSGSDNIGSMGGEQSCVAVGNDPAAQPRTGPESQRQRRGSGAATAAVGAATAADRLYPSGGSKHGGALFAQAAAPKFLLIDFSRVKGMDATAARTLGALFRDLTQMDITPVVTAASHRGIRQMLAAHGVPLPTAPAASAQEASPFLPRSAAELAQTQVHCHEFVSYEEGLRFCEQQLLAVAVRGGLCRPPGDPVPLEQLLTQHISQAGLPFASKEDSSTVAKAVVQYAECLRYRPGEALWLEGQPANELFIIEQGRVTVEQQVQQLGGVLPEAAVAVTPVARAPSSSGSDREPTAAGLALSQQQQQQNSSRGAIRVFEFGAGCIAGAVDFYLHRPRSSTAIVSGSSTAGMGRAAGSGGSSSCLALKLTREALGRMAAEAPLELNVLQAVVMRAKCLDLGAAAELAQQQASSSRR